MSEISVKMSEIPYQTSLCQ